jgi:hypothetical protein
MAEENEDFSECLNSRPVRRSRILSDDAKLARELQEQEWRYVRGIAGKKPKQEPAPAEHQSHSKAGSQKPQAARKQKAAGAPAIPPNYDNISEDRVAGSASQEISHAAADIPRRKLAAKRKARPEDQDEPGTISFTLVADEMKESLPATRPVHVMGEDSTVMQIKQLVIEKLLPGDSVNNVVLRTPAGLLLGNEHSLKYVRYFLWPPTKGQLNLVYSREKAFFM